ncbi:T9SS type A sorting domain-containing protein [bacterium]|nr:T9SS type A sorting domain-containing protein [bacterium]
MKKAMLLFSLVLAAGLVHAGPAEDAGFFVGQATLGPTDGPELQPYYFNADRTLSPDTLYTLRGQVYFEDGATLTIPAGTRIVGEPAGTIVIKQGGQIFVNGTPEEPVVMTSAMEPGMRSNGDWGGLVVLGRAPLNVDPAGTDIEGGIIEGQYGGDIADDSSGVIKYLRLEFPGYRFEEGNEINGLTMGGLGHGTELHHVQVSFANDDSYEWFGGNVDGHHLVALGGLDDDFDVDEGFRGRLQFLFAMKYPDIFDAAGSANGLENDSKDEAEPFSQPIYSNITMVGPERIDALVGNLPPGNTHRNMGVLRENTRSSIFNSVLVGFVRGWSLRDGSIQAALDGDLRIQNSSFTAMYDGYPDGSAHDTDRFPTIEDWLGTTAFNNNGIDQRLPSTVGLTDMSDLTNPQPQPQAFSELDGTADFSNDYLADVAGRYSFDTTANYRGAFAPGVAMDQQWTAGWTNFDPQNTTYFVAVEDLGELPLANATVRNYPNPFNPTTKVQFNLPRAGNVSLKVFDVAGRVVAELHEGDLPAGQFSIDFDGAGLSSGTYFARLQGDGFDAVQKMQLVK